MNRENTTDTYVQYEYQVHSHCTRYYRNGNTVAIGKGTHSHNSHCRLFIVLATTGMGIAIGIGTQLEDFGPKSIKY